jgi:3'-phosphoadenosine 5'-phosphosulfate sulfotransferase (PAPS reductase)/FAD synthetase
MTVNNVIFSSYGNDSIALIQFALSINLKNTVVLYSDTQWGDKHWELRVTRAEAWVRARGFATDRITSIGMKNLVLQRKGWPRQGIQFCTYELKIAPALEWLERNDPDKKAICLVGIRREESQKRRNFPEFTYNSPSHGGRTLWARLYITQKNNVIHL